MQLLLEQAVHTLISLCWRARRQECGENDAKEVERMRESETRSTYNQTRENDLNLISRLININEVT